MKLRAKRGQQRRGEDTVYSMGTGAEECSDGNTAAGPLFFLNDENQTRLDASHGIQ